MGIIIICLGIAALSYAIIAQQRQIGEVLAQATATVARGQEQEQANIALSRKLANDVQTMQNEPDLALLLSVQAYKISPTFEAKRSLFTSLANNPNLSTFLNSDSGEIENLEFSPDGNSLLSAGSDGKVLLWNLKTNFTNTQLVQGSGSPSLALDVRNQIIAYANNDNISLFDTKENKNSSITLPQGTLKINCMTFSPDGKTLVTGGGDLGTFSQVGQLIFWNTANLSEVGSPISLPYPVQSIAINTNGTVVALGLEDISGEQALMLFNVVTHEHLGKPINNIVTSAITSLAFSPDGKYLAVGSEAPGPASPGGAIGVINLTSMKYIGQPKTSSTN